MKNTSLKKLIRISALILVLAMVLGMSVVTALAEENLVPGPTVMKDPDSPTGYTVRFVYENATATSVTFVGDMLLRDWYDSTDTKKYQPSEYRSGLVRGSGAFEAPMTKVDDRYWVIEVPLSAGANQYWFYVNGNRSLWVTDPANSPIYAPDGLTGTARRAFNRVNVPFDPEKQDLPHDGARAIAENPRPDTPKGTWSYVPIVISGSTRYLGVYLPPQYDPDREEPYKTIYMQHGSQQDQSDWMNIGSCPVIMDNLIADGLTEPAVLVTTNSTYMGSAPYNNLTNIIVPFIEANYNVSTDRMDRAFGGLSMGAMMTNSIINNDPLRFGYYAPFSGGVNVNKTTPNLKSCYILFGTGAWDTTVRPPSQSTIDGLKGYMNFGFKTVSGGHDFNAWNQLFAIFVRDYLWQPRAFVNSPPVWSQGGEFSVDENRTLTFTVEATDPDEDELTYKTVGDLPSGASFDGETKEFTWTPDYTQAGTYTVTFIASDGDRWYNLSATKDVTITVRNVTVDEQIAGLKAMVAGLDLNEGNKNALTVKLDQVLKLLKMENDKSSEAVEALNGFIDQVNGWIGIKVTEEQAVGLIKAAQETILNITSK